MPIGPIGYVLHSAHFGSAEMACDAFGCPSASSLFAALTCPRCGGPLELIALLADGLVVRQILAHLRLPTEPLPLAPARAPPDPQFDG